MQESFLFNDFMSSKEMCHVCAFGTSTADLQNEENSRNVSTLCILFIYCFIVLRIQSRTFVSGQKWVTDIKGSVSITECIVLL